MKTGRPRTVWNALLRAVALAALLGGVAHGEAPSPWSFELDARGRWGPVRGFTQIPKGGAAGSTSLERPELDELGIEDGLTPDIVATVGWRAHRLRARASIVQLNGDATVDETFTTKATTFEHGARIESTTRFSTYSLGYRYEFSFAFGENSSVEISPALAGGIYEFGLSIDDETRGQSIDRSFVHLFPQVGVDIAYQPIERLRLHLSVMGFVPIDSIPLVIDAELTARVRLLQGSPDDGASTPSLDATLGLAYQLIEFEDKQPTPNETRFEYGPIVLVGLALSF